MKNTKLKRWIIVGSILIAVIGIVLIGWLIVVPSIRYNIAMNLYESDEFLQAADIFDKLGNYKNSDRYTQRCKNEYYYGQAVSLFEDDQFEQALVIFEELDSYEDAESYLTECKAEIKYKQAVALMRDENYEDAIELFTELGHMHDSAERIITCEKYIRYMIAEYIFGLGNYKLAKEKYEELSDFEDSSNMVQTLELLEEYYEFAEDLADGVSNLYVYEGSELKELYKNRQTKDIVKSDYHRYLYLNAVRSIKSGLLLTVEERLNALPDDYRQKEELYEIVSAFTSGNYDDFINLTKSYAELEYHDVLTPYFWELAIGYKKCSSEATLNETLKAYNCARQVKSISELTIPTFSPDDSNAFEHGMRYSKRLDSLVELCGQNADGKILILYANDNTDTKGSNICVYLMDLLPIELIPKSLDEVEYILSLEIYDEVVDIYNCGTSAVREIGTVKIIKCPSGKVVKNIGTLKGPAPPYSFSYTGLPPLEKHGGPVDQDAVHQLLLDAAEDYLITKKFGDYEYIVWNEEVVINKYLGNSKTPAVPDTIDNMTVVGIRERAFYEHKDITHITLPNGLTCITKYLFKDFTSLTEISIPDNVIRIENNSFEGCISLKKVNLNEGLMQVYSYAFSGCTSLIEVDFPSSVYHLGRSVFNDCTNLETINLPKMLLRINDECFAGCKSLKRIILPNTLQIIRKGAFKQSALEAIDLPDTVEYIGDEAFKQTPISEIFLPASVKYIDKNAFIGCRNLSEIVLPETILWIHPKNFSDHWMKVYVKEYSCAYSVLINDEDNYVKAEVIVEEYD